MNEEQTKNFIAISSAQKHLTFCKGFERWLNFPYSPSFMKEQWRCKTLVWLLVSFSIVKVVLI